MFSKLNCPLIRYAVVIILDFFNRHGGRMDNKPVLRKVISLRWDDCWGKYEKRTRMYPRGEQAKLEGDLPRAEKHHKSKNRHSRNFRRIRDSLETLSLASKAMKEERM